MVPNFRDPRLTDTLLLLLAGRRVQHRLAQPPLPDWDKTEGLCALLQAAKLLPQRDPWALPALEPETSFSPLLREARQWREEHAREA
jgi:hypothetical protein